MNKIILDTNLLVAAFFNKQSASNQIIKRIEQGQVTNLWSEPIKKEAETILSQIPPIEKKYLDKIEKNLFKDNRKVKNPPNVNLIEEDPEDNKFIEGAVKGGADFIISNDDHLLRHSGYKGIKILTPDQFVKQD